MAPLSRTLARRASGPARLRQRLGAARGQLLHAVARSRAVEGLRAGIPGAVFGGDLLETLSGTLRGLLTARDEQAAAASERVRLPVATLTQRATSRRHHRQESAVAPASARRAHDDRTSADATASRLSIPDADPGAPRARPAFDATPAAIGTGLDGATPFRAEHAGNTDLTWPEGRTERAPRSSAHPMAASLLGRRVSEYLRLARADAQRRQGESRDASTSGAEIGPSPTPVPRPRLAWPDHLSGRALDTLQRFEAANERTPVPIDRDRTLSPNAEAPHASRPWRTSDAGDGNESIRDLSAQMAEVLRTQALRHGIDLT